MTTLKPLKVLVTGGSGFVGSAVTAALLRRGHTLVSTTHVMFPRLAVHERLSWVLWDARQRVLPDVPWQSVDVLLHLAIPENPFDFPNNAQLMYNLAVQATFGMLEQARAAGVRRVLAASTGSVLVSADHPGREDETCYSADSFYAAAKACSELLLRSYSGILSTAILRFYHPYGPGGDRFLVNRLLDSVARGRPVTIEGPDGILLNPTWVDDLAEGVCRAVESTETGIFHFAGPDTLSLRQLLLLMGEVVGRTPVIQCIDRAVNRRHVGEFERSSRLLGYQPRTSVREGLERLAATRAASVAAMGSQE